MTRRLFLGVAAATLVLPEVEAGTVQAEPIAEAAAAPVRIELAGLYEAQTYGIRPGTAVKVVYCAADPLAVPYFAEYVAEDATTLRLTQISWGQPPFDLVFKPRASTSPPFCLA